VDRHVHVKSRRADPDHAAIHTDCPAQMPSPAHTQGTDNRCANGGAPIGVDCGHCDVPRPGIRLGT
jgi:hypothetical protein